MRSPHLDVQVARSYEELEAHLPAWWELHDVRLEDNVFTSPAYLPEVYRQGTVPVNVGFAYRVAGGHRTLVAVAPFGSPTRVGGLSVLPSCQSNFVYSSTPLLHGELAADGARAVLDWLDRSGSSMACWENLELDSEAWQLMQQQLDDNGRRWWVRHEFERATMKSAAPGEDWMGVLTAKARSEYRRCRRKLEAAGELEVILHRNLEDFDLVPRFLQLEARGWKGDQGTALLAKPRQAEFMDRVARALAARNELFFVEVRVDDEPASITANLVDGTTMFGFKVAHAPELNRASPGIFNTFEVLRLVQEDVVVTAADSGTEDGSCLRRYWPESRRVGTVLAATRGFAGGAVLSMLPAARWTRHEARRILGRLRGGDRAATA